MPDYGMGRKTTGGPKSGASQPASKNYDVGSQGGFGNGKGARNKGSLKNDNGAGGGKWKDTDNDQSGSGFGGGMGRPGRGGY